MLNGYKKISYLFTLSRIGLVMHQNLAQSLSRIRLAHQYRRERVTADRPTF